MLYIFVVAASVYPFDYGALFHFLFFGHVATGICYKCVKKSYRDGVSYIFVMTLFSGPNNILRFT